MNGMQSIDLRFLFRTTKSASNGWWPKHHHQQRLFGCLGIIDDRGADFLVLFKFYFWELSMKAMICLSRYLYNPVFVSIDQKVSFLRSSIFHGVGDELFQKCLQLYFSHEGIHCFDQSFGVNLAQLHGRDWKTGLNPFNFPSGWFSFSWLRSCFAFALIPIRLPRWQPDFSKSQILDDFAQGGDYYTLQLTGWNSECTEALYLIQSMLKLLVFSFWQWNNPVLLQKTEWKAVANRVEFGEKLQFADGFFYYPLRLVSRYFFSWIWWSKKQALIARLIL